ncbi:MAG: hypothetical protein MUO82_09245 [Candidatus Thermoplasmatota archaeon]|nr:hypothetical protein [Candidatus Thermoplasmatota archaeon]
MSKTKIVLKNIGLGMIYKPISIVISFIVVPITIAYIGGVNYGLWATILSIISWISFFDIGIGNGLRNYLANVLALKDYENARKYIATSYGVIIAISICLLAILAILCSFLDWETILNTSDYDNSQLTIILFVNVLFICVNFILKLITTIYYAMQKSSIIGMMQIVNQLLNLVGIYYLSTIGYSRSLLGISLVYGIASVLVNLIFSYILFTNHRELIPKLQDFDSSKIKDLTNLGLKFFIIQIAAMIIFTTDNLIITRLFGPEEVTPYILTYKVFSLIIMLHDIIITPIWSAITKAYAEMDIIWMKKILKRLNYFQLLIIMSAVLMCFIFPHLIKIWIKVDVGISSRLISMYALYTVLITFCNNYAYIFNGIGDIDFQLIIAVTQGIVNIPISIYFAKYLNMGIEGVILGTNVTMLLAALTYPIKAKKIISTLVKNF